MRENGFVENSIADIIGQVTPTSAITQLNQLNQRGVIRQPVFRLVEKHIKENVILWKCELHISNVNHVAKGTGSTKKEARRAAAYEMVKYLVKLDEEE